VFTSSAESCEDDVINDGTDVTLLRDVGAAGGAINAASVTKFLSDSCREAP
jgi:hypothetical protein